MAKPLTDEQVWGTPTRDPIVPAAVIDDPTQLGVRQAMLKLQMDQAADGPREGPQGRPLMQCPCGRDMDVCAAYKCLFCGIWFCAVCARRHFAKTECATEGLVDVNDE